MGQRPCTLCCHQRAFMFPLAVVLAVACFRSDPQAWRYALPLAGIGWLLSGYHSLLYTGVIPEPITPCDSTIPCSGAGMTLWGYLSIPLLSFGSFSAIALLFVAVYSKNTPFPTVCWSSLPRLSNAKSTSTTSRHSSADRM